MSGEKQRPDDLVDFIVGVVCVTGVVIALGASVWLAYHS